MDCIALFDSGNYANRVSRLFEMRGLNFPVISTPCRVSKSGCGYCLLFPEKYLSQVIEAGKACNCPVGEIYRIIEEKERKKYIKIF